MSEIEPWKNGQAGVVIIDHKKTAVYKDEAGQVHAVSAICTHMGCTIGWNADERTWDCPCHGSRYSIEGKVLRGPAKKDLERVEIDYLKK